jgi:hypothetical protein
MIPTSKRQTSASRAAVVAQLAHPKQHRYMVFQDDTFERKTHYMELFSHRIGFEQVSLVKNLTTVRKTNVWTCILFRSK